MLMRVVVFPARTEQNKNGWQPHLGQTLSYVKADFPCFKYKYLSQRLKDWVLEQST